MEETVYTVHQVARISGASVRALHHYEAKGLLKPRRLENGYRVYGPADIERLQHIMLYRTCGVALSDIGTLLDSPDFDAKTTLQNHLVALERRKEELETLMDTVRKTIRALEGDAIMSDKERFEGLKRATIDENERAYGREARKRHGDAAVDAANERLMAMDEREWNDMNALETALIEQLKAAMATGDASGEESRELARMHARWIEGHWGKGAYSREAHLQLAQGYLADSRFTAYYDKAAGAGATQFLVDALQACL